MVDKTTILEKNIEIVIVTEKTENFFAYVNQPNINAVIASFVTCEMIVKSSRPFIEGLIIKASKILCPSKEIN